MSFWRSPLPSSQRACRAEPSSPSMSPAAGPAQSHPPSWADLAPACALPSRINQHCLPQSYIFSQQAMDGSHMKFI